MKRIKFALFFWVCAVVISMAQTENDSLYNNLQIFNSDSLEIRDLKSFGFPLSDGNEVKLLMSGHDKFEDLFEHVKQAKSFIHLEYFNFRNDSINTLLVNLLHQKVKQGVEVRVLYDAFGNSSNNRPIKKEKHDSINALGIQLYKYDPIKFPWVNHLPRDHRKIVVIDGIYAYTGGMNVADYYIDGLEGIGEWRDMHMRIKGPAVNDIHRIFVDMWAKETGFLLSGAKYFPVWNNGPGKAKLAIVDRHTKTAPKSIRQLYISMLNNAKKSVKIISPYFIPTTSVKKAIADAIKRGVDVQILVSEHGDIPLTPDASLYVAHKLMKKGAKVFVYQKGFHHAKIMMVDDTFCTVGSSNLNSRSLRYDLEINAAIFDLGVTRQLVDMFENDKKNSILLDEQNWKSRSTWRKANGWFGNLLTPFL